MALGAERRQVWALVLAQGIRLALVGISLGAFAALFLVRFLRSQLFEVRTFDPATFVLTSVVLFSVSLVACFVPARRATKVDPMTALRYE